MLTVLEEIKLTVVASYIQYRVTATVDNEGAIENTEKLWSSGTIHDTRGSDWHGICCEFEILRGEENGFNGRMTVRESMFSGYAPTVEASALIPPRVFDQIKTALSARLPEGWRHAMTLYFPVHTDGIALEQLSGFYRIPLTAISIAQTAGSKIGCNGIEYSQFPPE